MTRLLYIVIVLFFLTLSNSCSFSNADQPAAGRYAVQWKSYIGALEGETINPSFSFIDLHPQRNTQENPQINQLQLLTNRGDFPADVGSITLSEPHANYQLFTISAKVHELPAGLYTFDTIQYVDETR